MIEAIRALEKRYGRPTTILADLQGPKLRVGKFAGGKVELVTGATFTLDRDTTPGDATRVELPHTRDFRRDRARRAAAARRRQAGAARDRA